MDAIGGQELLHAGAHAGRAVAAQRALSDHGALQAAGPQGAEMVLAMTHEECITTHVAQLVRSYRDLPMILYHFQTKERDEPRPRAGILARASSS
jgi:prolyl-tRNA synthetase